MLVFERSLIGQKVIITVPPSSEPTQIVYELNDVQIKHPMDKRPFLFITHGFDAPKRVEINREEIQRSKDEERAKAAAAAAT